MRRPSTSPLAGLWKLDDPPGDAIANGSENEAAGRRNGNVTMQSADRNGQPAAARFQGGAHVTVDNREPFVFKPGESFTVQSWFQTSSQENQVIAARPGAYSLGVKAGNLSAWIMQDGGQFVEAAGAANAADGKWHHTAAVYNRQAQTLTLYFDGKPDGAPQDIAAIGASASPAPLTLGAFGGGFPFEGTLDEVSIHRAALAPADFSFSADYRTVPPAKLGALTGRYTTVPCDWGQLVRVTSLRTTATLHDGNITAQLETSNDDFTTIAATHGLELRSGDHTTPLPSFPPARYARITFTLATPATAEHGPILTALELVAEPHPG